MTAVTYPGGFWAPNLTPRGTQDTASGGNLATGGTLDADEEEFQIIGRVFLAAGSGSKTFGTSGSELQWLPGTPITFADDGSSDPTLRVGVKAAADVDLANGPAVRATIGQAAFDVYKDLVGGTDTITAVTWRNDAMAAGTPFSVAHGDYLAICFHLDKPGAGAQSVLIRGLSAGSMEFPSSTQVTSGPTYTTVAQAHVPVLKFDDGSYGWIEGARAMSTASSETIGNTNLYGNIFRFPFDVSVNAILVHLSASAGTTNFDIGLWSDPGGTPSPMTNGTVSFDPQHLASGKWLMLPLPAEQVLTGSTDYFAAVKQNSATAIGIDWHDVDQTAHWQMHGLDSTCYAAKSTGGAAVSQQNSGKRRAAVYLRVSAIDIPTGGGGMLRHPGMTGGLNA